MKILSLSFAGHDHNASYFDGYKVVYSKFERQKQVKRFSYSTLDDMLNDVSKYFNVLPQECDVVVISCNEDLTQEYSLVPGLVNYFKHQNFINRHKLKSNKTFLISHHYAHALSVDFMVNKKPKVKFVIDGLGDDRTWSVYKENKLVAYGTKETGSIGWNMRDMGTKLGVKAKHQNDIAGKLMSLFSYGEIDFEFLNKIKFFTMYEIDKIFDFNLWVSYKGDAAFSQKMLLDWGATVNYAMHDVLLAHFKNYAELDDVITYSGGVAQNVVWNTTLKKHFKNLTIAPHSSDEGLSIGGLQWAADYFGKQIHLINFPYVQLDLSPNSIPSNKTFDKTVEALASGKIVGWYQGNGEVGPRALGNRSILMDPRLLNGKEIVNKIKNRENYRPFGASVLTEYKNKYFDLDWEDPYMLYTAKVKTNTIPTVTHIDGTCRVQTVDDVNPLFKTLIEKFYLITGCPVLLNTSLNVAGRPIAGNPQDALELFNNSPLDMLVIGNTLYDKG